MLSTSFPIRIRSMYFGVMVGTTFAICPSLVGCQQTSPPMTGGDTPVTIERLTGTRLSDIREPLSWSFTDSTVVIEYDGKPIPSDVVEALLGDGSTPAHIEASWRIDEVNGTLHLTGMKSDQTSIDKEVTIPIAPAGHVRLNLGTRQYNLFHERANHP